MKTKILIAIILSGLMLAFYMQKKYGLLGYFNLVSNKCIVKNNLSEADKNFLELYWVSSINSKKNDTLAIYQNNKIVNTIPNEYGVNRLIVKVKDKEYDKLGHFKFRPWYRHRYILRVENKNQKIVIEFQIKGKSPSDLEKIEF